MKQILFILLLFVGGNILEAQKLVESRPNIIFVMTDDQGSNLSYMGHPYVSTPNIDEFAKQSMYFSEFHVSPTCAPTRAAIMSGRHEFKNGVTHTIHEREYMALSTTTFPQLLQKAGYKTGIFGKWHLGDEEDFLPGNRGFSEVFIHGAGGIGQYFPKSSNADFPPNRVEKNRYFDNVLLHNNKIVKTKGYCTDVFFQGALGWIKKQHEAKQPYFAYISTNTPHAPSIAPEESLQRIVDRHPSLTKKGVGRYGMIENIDDNFGILMKKLKEWNALENTLIIFTTDNGAPHSAKARAKGEFNAGYKTGKGSEYEGGVHVPAFWYWKNVLPSGTKINALTAHIDLYKTFCELAGAKIPNNIQKLDGRSLIPLLENSKTKWKDRTLFTHVGRWGAGTPPNKKTRWAVRTQKWRLVGDKLYDIENDPYESTNVAEKHPETVEKLNESYNNWWKKTLPYMINENRKYKIEDPLGKRYYKQKEEEGIPDWIIPSI